jgi:hypothetical protein
MKIPAPRDLFGQVLAASQGAGITHEDLRKRLIFEFGMYEGSATAPSLEQILRFSRRALRAQQRLLEAKLVCELEGRLRTTKLGDAFLREGCTRVDEQTLARLVQSLPTQETLPLEQPTADEPEPSETQPAFDAKALLAEAGLRYFRLGKDTYAVIVEAALRTWKIQLWFANGWLRGRVYIMRVPKTNPVRAQLLQAALRVNEVAVPHFSVDDEDGLYLSLDEQLENLDADGLRSLVCALYSVAQDQYPRLFRLVTQEDVLASLETAYKRSA